jgi:hypothetical protein
MQRLTLLLLGVLMALGVAPSVILTVKHSRRYTKQEGPAVGA